MTYVISDNGLWGSYMALRERKAKYGGRKLHNEKIHDFEHSSGVIM